MTSAEIRNSFLNFFRDHGHTIVPSSSVVPYDDPTLLFANAGMNQFKDVFLGTGKRTYTRSADTQKCIRVSGKHNDLEEVGRDTYHHTFFEMLGNWSFGDYYKKEAIEWAWELLTNVWKLPKSRLWATVYEDDAEAERYWKTVTDINPSHVLKFGEKDNFWEMGETGPCGPCSEIHIDRTPDGTATASLINAGLPSVMEIWNLVFIQYNRDNTGKLTPLPAKHVDTGMGFERVCAVLQGKDSNYDTDVFSPIIRRICEITGKKYSGTLPTDQRSEWTDFDIAIRVIADHSRMLSFAIADGAVPSNKDRGYILQQVLKRAARFGRILNMHEPFVYHVVDTVVDTMGNAYPELREKQAHIKTIIKREEERFSETEKNGFDFFYRNVIGEPIRQAFIARGTINKSWWVDTLKSDGNTLVLLSADINDEKTVNIRDELKKLTITHISGADAFKLHDTFGVHIDTTKSLADQIGIDVDITGFEELMEQQRVRSRTPSVTNLSLAGHAVNIVVTTLPQSKERAKNLGTKILENTFKFDGYEVFQEEVEIHSAVDDLVVCVNTPFYGESGGQVGDQGFFQLTDGTKLNVIDTQKAGNVNVHILQSPFDWPSAEKKALGKIDIERRLRVASNHTATHLVHEALRQVLGTHLHQQGSLVAPEYLRFDFNHFEKISPEHLKAIEDIVNEKITGSIPVNALNDPKQWLTIEDAKRKYPNVKMFFGDKYGDRVRIVEIDPKFSVELCGGTHVRSTKDIGFFKFRSEGSIASGIRRIEAVTGDFALELLKLQEKSITERIDYASEQLGKIKELLTKVQHVNAQAVPAGSDLLPTFAQTLEKLKSTFDRPGKISMELRTYFERHAFVGREVENLILRLADMLKALEKEVGRNRLQTLSSDIEDLVAHAVSINGFKLVATKVQSASVDELKSLGDSLRAKLGSGVGLIASIIDDKVSLVCVVTDDLVASKKVEAGKIVGAVAKLVGGGGGGRPHMATAGGKDVAKLDEAISQTKSIVESFLRK